jgi:two-component system sensor histidine kinase KdpD
MRRDALRLMAAGATIGAVTFVYTRWLNVTNATTVALTFLLVVLLVAATSRLWMAIVTSIGAMLCFNFFFLPPVGTLTISDPQNWVALIAFLAVSLVASNLSSVARAREHEAIARRDELSRLFDLSRDVLLMTESGEALSVLARFVARRFDLDYAAIHLPRGAEWDVWASGEAGAGQPIESIPLRLGARTVGRLDLAGRLPEAGALDAVGGVVAIAIERAHFLEELKAADLARQSEELKSALLASIAHDLRTPLTAIRVGASNLQASWLTETDRREQSELVLGEVGRLSRLFENILEMARIDAGAIAATQRWVHLSEIVEAARDQAGQTLALHPVEVDLAGDALVRVDPRLTAAALAQLLENASQYAPAGSAITIGGEISQEGLVISVRDRGPGIATADLPHVFERFYRGADAKRRAAGTGMGLSIARGLLAAENGRIWAENCADGGARLTIAVPAERRPVEQDA